MGVIWSTVVEDSGAGLGVEIDFFTVEHGQHGDPFLRKGPGRGFDSGQAQHNMYCRITKYVKMWGAGFAADGSTPLRDTPPAPFASGRSVGFRKREGRPTHVDLRPVTPSSVGCFMSRSTWFFSTPLGGWAALGSDPSVALSSAHPGRGAGYG